MNSIPSGFEPQNPVAIAAIRAARLNPRPLSSEDEREFFEFRKRASVRRIDTIRLIRRGRLVFRIRGRRGGDLPCHPFEYENQQAFAKHQQTIGRVFRRSPNPALGVRARQTKAQARAQRVLDLYPTYRHRKRNAGALIAKVLKEPVHYVQRILRENVHDRKE